MKAMMMIACLCLLAAPVFAAGKSCEELKSEIAAKLDAKGVTGHELAIVATEEVADQKVVGSCEAGAKKIVYKRN